MKTPDTPNDEAIRLAALKSLNILDTPSEARYDRITRLACKALNAPIALMSLIDSDRQWFKSAQGTAATETERSISFCGHAINSDDLFVIADATLDERFADNPLVTGALGIRSYAAKPLHGPNGDRIGTLCVIDNKPRQLDGEELSTLEDLGELIEMELRADALSSNEKLLRQKLSEAERRASVDNLTRVWNRSAISQLLENELDRSKREKISLGVMMLDLDRFKIINDTYGHPSGDIVLAESSQRIRSALRNYDSVGRYGGEEFLLVLPNCNANGATFIAERVRQRIASAPIVDNGHRITVTASIGVSLCDGLREITAEAIIAEADRAMYRAKSGGRNRAYHFNH